MVRLRRTVQILSLLLFFFLLITTRVKIEENFYRIQSPIWANLYFLTDPLTYVSASAASRGVPAVSWLPLLLMAAVVLLVGRLFFGRLSSRAMTAVVIAGLFAVNFVVFFSPTAPQRWVPAVNPIPLLVMVGLVLLLGRFFCGWLCPLGVLIDGAAKVWKPPKKPQPSRWVPSSNLKFYILLVILITAVFGVNIVGFLDPITILFRAMVYAVQPYVEWVVKSVLEPLWVVPVVNRVSEPLLGVLRKYYLTADQPHYHASLLFLVILLVIFGLSKIRRRYWCRYLCPLGAFHALLGRFGFWRRRVSPACTECTVCARLCRTEAIDKEDFALYDTRECIMCMDCREVCPEKAIEFSFVPSSGSVRVSERELHLTRRGLLKAVGASIVVMPVLRPTDYSRKEDIMLRATSFSRSDEVTLLRPPGAAEERQFLARCIRCGECMRACPQHALQPALLQYGLEKMWTPVLTPRVGYCEYNCTLCMQVCPTGALEVLSQRVKQHFRMGTAFFDKNRCIPWAENSNCLVCEEVCPTPKKSIRMREEVVLDDTDVRRVVKRPYIIEENCIGCGMCEHSCPVEGLAAIRVVPRYETRHGGLAVGGGFVQTGQTGAVGQTGVLGEVPTTGTTQGGASPYGGGSSNPYK